MRSNFFKHAVVTGTITGALLIAAIPLASAQSGATRPRRTLPNSTPPPATTNPSATNDAPARQPAPAVSANTKATPGGSGDTMQAYNLLQQKQYAAALKEAKRIAAADPKNSEAWKIAGFAGINLQQFAEAAGDLQRALDLQRAAGQEDPNTVNALAQAYVRSEAFDRALPLLVTATTKPGAQPDPTLLYYRGLAEFRTGKKDAAEGSFTAAVKVDPKNAAALFYLGQIAYDSNRFDVAVNNLNRATLSDPRLANAWSLLTTSYLQRAAAAGSSPKADADYLNAVRAGKSLFSLRPEPQAATLYGQALIGAKQYAQAATVLESVATGEDAPSSTLYLLGIAHSRVKNFPKAITALERAAAKTPDNVQIYRELGYAYEVSKQYPKALAAYQKGASLEPAAADFKESIERVQPFAK